jgi:hypothetical protein
LKAKFTLLRILSLTLLLVLPLAAPGVADDALIQVLDTGFIDWSAGTIRVNGMASPAPPAIDAEESSDSPSEVLDAAWRMAQSRLFETVSALRINAISTVADRVAQSNAFRDGLTTLTRNASLTRQEYLSDGTVEIELTMNLTGGFAQFVLPEEIRQVDSVTTMTLAEPEAEKMSMPADDNGGRPHTGMIFDATGIGAKPSLVPLVVDESGEVVYGPAFVSREFAVSRGMCGYATTLAAARNDKRVGDRPLVVKALRTPSTGETDLVVSSTDAARLRSSVIHLNFLKACRVNIVIDAKADHD